MRPKIWSKRPRMTFAATPYEPQRRRLRWIERMEAWRLQAPAPVARQSVARRLHLTPDQLVNIRRGRLRDLYGDIKAASTRRSSPSPSGSSRSLPMSWLSRARLIGRLIQFAWRRRWLRSTRWKK